MGRASLDVVDGGVTTRARKTAEPAASGFGRIRAGIKAGWLRFAGILAKVNSAILLTVIYFLIIAPTHLVLRITRADPLSRRMGDDPSFWRAPEYRCDDLESCRKQF